MEKVEKPTALQPQEMTFSHARTIQFTLVSPVASGAPYQLLSVQSGIVMTMASAMRAFRFRCVLVRARLRLLISHADTVADCGSPRAKHMGRIGLKVASIAALSNSAMSGAMRPRALPLDCLPPNTCPLARLAGCDSPGAKKRRKLRRSGFEAA
jgi:hypothetical protein